MILASPGKRRGSASTLNIAKGSVCILPAPTLQSLQPIGGDSFLWGKLRWWWLAKRNCLPMLPPHWDYDCPIVLQAKVKAPYGQIYAMFKPELAILCVYIWEKLAKAPLPPEALVLFVKKKHGKLHLCIISLGPKLVNGLKLLCPAPNFGSRSCAVCQIFHQTGPLGVYNLMCIRAREEWNSAF